GANSAATHAQHNNPLMKIIPDIGCLLAKAVKLRGCPWWQVGGWGVAGAVLAGVPKCAGQGLRQGDGSGQQCPVEVAGFVPAQQLFTVGCPGEAAFAFEESGKDGAGLGRVAGGQPS